MFEGVISKTYKIGIYIRLSKEDADKGYDESESITNQKLLLIDYVKKLGLGYKLVDTYIDRGYTGTNFNRPDFKRMINDINLGKINMVITKDLSRLGRDYIETGEYVEKWFPEKKVRYVSITDGIDTFSSNNGNNDIAPFKAILNDMYSKDLSKKIKTALRTMQLQGKWVGGKTALGYRKSIEDKNKLVIFEEEAKIVKLIFNMAYSGMDISSITNYLNQNNIPTTNQIRYGKIIYWSSRTIKKILTNKTYIGMTIQNKRSRISYKNRKIRENPEDEWIVVENTHEPIIDRNVFENVQKMRISQKFSRNEKKNCTLLDGLLVCYECKHKIGVKKGQNGRLDMICSYYRRYSKLKICSSHGFNYYKLEKIVLEYLRNLFLDINIKEIELNMSKSKSKYDYKKNLDKLKNDIIIINDNIDKMYIDKLNEKVSEEIYERLFQKLRNDVKIKEKEYKELEELINNSMNGHDEEIINVVNQFLKLKNPTKELMRMIINRIEIHQDKQVDIIFNFKKLNSY